MSQTRGKQVVSICGLFGRKSAQKDVTAPINPGHYNRRKRQVSPPLQSKVFKATKRPISNRFIRRNFKVADPSMDISSGNRSPDGERLLHGFVDSINATRYQIEEEVSKSLEETEKALEKRFVQTVVKHDERLDLSLATRAAIFSPLEPESQGKQTSLGRNKHKAHLIGVRSILNAHKKVLKSHWKAWAKTQQQIACLAVGILGPDSVTLPPVEKKAPGSRTFKKRLASAVDVFEKQEFAELKKLEEEQKIKDDIACLARGARKQGSAQEKKSRDGKRKQTEEVCQLARKMIANI